MPYTRLMRGGGCIVVSTERTERSADTTRARFLGAAPPPEDPIVRRVDAAARACSDAADQQVEHVATAAVGAASSMVMSGRREPAFHIRRFGAFLGHQAFARFANKVHVPASVSWLSFCGHNATFKAPPMPESVLAGCLAACSCWARRMHTCAKTYEFLST